MKGRKTEFAGNPCPIARTLGIIGDWWSLLIIRDALDRPQRFGEFQKHLGLAKNILATRLRKLVEAEILTTSPASDGSPFSEYHLTAKGEQLYLVLAALWQWGERYMSAPGGRPLQIVDRKNHQPVPPLQLRSQDGRSLGPRDFTVVSSDAVPPQRAIATPI